MVRQLEWAGSAGPGWLALDLRRIGSWSFQARIWHWLLRLSWSPGCSCLLRLALVTNEELTSALVRLSRGFGNLVPYPRHLNSRPTTLIVDKLTRPLAVLWSAAYTRSSPHAFLSPLPCR
jgi:hypothetical protein